MPDGEMSGENLTRWGNWRKKDILGRWNWLRELGLSPRRRPGLYSTAELGGPKTDEIENEIPESIGGVVERDLNAIDTTKGPKLAIAEWNKLITCERP